jgi:hypothetical protein
MRSSVAVIELIVTDTLLLLPLPPLLPFSIPPQNTTRRLSMEIFDEQA